MAYALKFRPAARRELKKIPRPDQEKIVKRIESLKQKPRPPDMNKLKSSDDLYRIRIGDYRVIYQIHDDIRIVRVTRVARRNKAYRKG